MESSQQPPPGYEFTVAQNRVMQATGGRVRLWGIFTLLGGGLTALMALVVLLEGGALGIVGALIYGGLSLIPIFIGLNFLRAGKALGAVADTEGSDIAHVMRAMETLGKAFLIQIVAAVVWVALVVVGVILAIAIPTFAG